MERLDPALVDLVFKHLHHDQDAKRNFYTAYKHLNSFSIVREARDRFLDLFLKMIKWFINLPSSTAIVFKYEIFFFDENNQRSYVTVHMDHLGILEFPHRKTRMSMDCMGRKNEYIDKISNDNLKIIRDQIKLALDKEFKITVVSQQFADLRNTTTTTLENPLANYYNFIESAGPNPPMYYDLPIVETYPPLLFWNSKQSRCNGAKLSLCIEMFDTSTKSKPKFNIDPYTFYVNSVFEAEYVVLHKKELDPEKLLYNFNIVCEQQCANSEIFNVTPTFLEFNNTLHFTPARYTVTVYENTELVAAVKALLENYCKTWKALNMQWYLELYVCNAFDECVMYGLKCEKNMLAIDLYLGKSYPYPNFEYIVEPYDPSVITCNHDELVLADFHEKHLLPLKANHIFLHSVKSPDEKAIDNNRVGWLELANLLDQYSRNKGTPTFLKNLNVCSKPKCRRIVLD